MITVWLFVGIIIVCFGFIVLRGAPYVPTHRAQLRRAFDELYSLQPSDTLVDLGSGDGIVLQEASFRGAAAIGYELNPFLVVISKWRLRKHPRVSVSSRDFLLLRDLPDTTTLVYAFTTGRTIEALGKKMQQWSRTRPLYFISYGFRLKNRQPLRSSGPMHLYYFEPSVT